MKKFLVTALCYATPLCANSQWQQTAPRVYDYFYDGAPIAKYLDMQHVVQPSRITCGAATIATAVEWLTYKANKPISYSVQSVYDYVNADRVEGLTSNELKTGLTNVVSYANQTLGLNVSLNLFDFGYDDPYGAVYGIWYRLNTFQKPSILYGNTKWSDSFFQAGSHYYVANGAVYCPTEKCGQVLAGLFLLDSTHSSTSFTDRQHLTVKPGYFVTMSEVEQVWNKTGSSLPWERKHRYLGI
jgi:hypothetical protein